MSDVFSIHPQNHRCFLYQGKPFKILTSAEHYGAVLNADFEYDTYLEEMQRTGQNATRVFTFYRETPSCIPEPGRMNTLAPRPEASVMPWERVSGQGQAADGLDKFDLDRWNEAYFARLKDYVGKCAEAGVICEIVLFCNPYDQRKYDLFPCSRTSNVNGVGEDLEDFRDFMTLKAPGVVAFQERFVRQIVAELNPFGNLYYELCNEAGAASDQAAPGSHSWHAHLARLIRRTEENLPEKHLIAANPHGTVRVEDGPEGTVVRHEDLACFENPDIDIVNYHYISGKAPAGELCFVNIPWPPRARAGLVWRFLRRRDTFRKPIVFDETFSGIVRGAPERHAVNRAEAWETILSGGAGYSNLDWTFTPGDATGAGQAPIGDGRRLDGRPLRAWLHILHRLLARHDLAELQPAADLFPPVVEGYGHAGLHAGQGRYILYFVDENLHASEPCPSRPLSVSLDLPRGWYAARMLDPRTGAEQDLPELRSDGAATLEIPAFSEDAAILLDPQG